MILVCNMISEDHSDHSKHVIKWWSSIIGGSLSIEVTIPLSLAAIALREME